MKFTTQPQPADPKKQVLRVERDSQTLTQKVADNLRNAIRNGQFTAGERLVERTLCEMTGVSRTAVREALRSLETEGLVVNAPNRGPTVAAISLEEAGEIYEVRRMLETRAVELFMKRMTASDIASLSETMEAMERALAANDLKMANYEKERFYAVLLTGCGNRLIARTLNQLHGQIALLRYITMAHGSRISIAVRELRTMFDAINERKLQAARRACRQHIAGAEALARKALQGPCEHPSGRQISRKSSTGRRVVAN